VSTTDLPQAPDATFVKRRWIPHQKAEWVRQCDQILREYGAVVDDLQVLVTAMRDEAAKAT
jgi:hypothetical protein